jgi:hypothetical protein
MRCNYQSEVPFGFRQPDDAPAAPVPRADGSVGAFAFAPVVLWTRDTREPDS